MRKLATVAVSIGVILVIVGLVMVGIFGGEQLKNISWSNIVNGTNHDLSKAETHYELNEDQLANLTKVVVNSDVYSVYVLPSEDNMLSVKYVEPDDDEFKINVVYDEQSSTLTVTEQGTSHIHISWFWSDWFNGNNFIAIYLPHSESIERSSLGVTVNTGSIKVENLTLADVKCVADTGSVSISDCSVGAVNLETKTGSASVDKLICNNLTAETKTGSVSVTETNVEQTVDIDVRTGSVNCNVTTNKLVINDNTGSVNFKVNANVIKIETKTGSVSGIIIGVKEEYQITVEKDTGKSNISNQNVANATKFLDVEVNTGSINIKFENK